jgi:RNA polymerase sigma-70 factor (ECF subfamily)
MPIRGRWESKMDAGPGLRDPHAAQPPADAVDLIAATEVFLGARPRLTGLAQRILGDASDAEDVVQEAWVRWQGTDRAAVRNPMAFLTTATTRLALNVAQSAYSRRESDAEPWVLERPDRRIGPEAEAERRDAVERAVSLLLGRLNPTERAAYILREAFGYPYQQIADILLLKPAHVRQLVRRARSRVRADRRRPVSSAAHRRLVTAFRTAARSGDLSGLERLLVADTAG